MSKPQRVIITKPVEPMEYFDEGHQAWSHYKDAATTYRVGRALTLTANLQKDCTIKLKLEKATNPQLIPTSKIA